MLFFMCFVFLCLCAVMCGYLYNQTKLTFPSHSSISSIERNVRGLSSCQEFIDRPPAEINIQMPCVTQTWAACTFPGQFLNLRNKSYCNHFSEDCVLQYDTFTFGYFGTYRIVAVTATDLRGNAMRGDSYIRIFRIYTDVHISVTLWTGM